MTIRQTAFTFGIVGYLALAVVFLTLAMRSDVNPGIYFMGGTVLSGGIAWWFLEQLVKDRFSES